ncbi:MAG: class II glutamine amidotransferase [Nitrospinae bacterium]|nr:class II glutamine amidotransferase [Nitrospinota bacterium]
MCVIAIKKKGVPVPSDGTLRKCFEANPHGAGMMYLTKRCVRVRKGLMTWKAFKAAHDSLRFGDDSVVVYHFRKATRDNVNPGNTHPFPVTKDVDVMRRTDGRYKMAMAHNGTLRNHPSDGMSDTQLFVRDVLVAPVVRENLHDASVRELIEGYISGSLVAILDADGLLHTLGDGWEEDGDGVMFSNMRWREDRVPTYYSLDGKGSLVSYRTRGGRLRIIPLRLRHGHKGASDRGHGLLGLWWPSEYTRPSLASGEPKL